MQTNELFDCQEMQIFSYSGKHVFPNVGINFDMKFI